jgi:glutathione S-transferase
MDWQLGTLAEAFLPMYRGLIRERLGATGVEPARQRTARLFEMLNDALTGHRYVNGPELTIAGTSGSRSARPVATTS